MIVHVPHASRHIPPAERERIVLDDATLERELDAITDAYTDRLAEQAADRAGTRPWVFVNQASRLLIDPERFPDEREEMLAVGMGVVYTRTTTGDVLRKEDLEDDRRLIDTYYEPYAQAIGDLVDERLAAIGAVVVIDVHSYPKAPLPYELHPDQDRPPLCIGVDAFHTPAEFPALLELLWPDRAVVNEPFAGCYIPLRHFRRSKSVRGVMLEIRRDCLDPALSAVLVAATAAILDMLDADLLA